MASTQNHFFLTAMLLLVFIFASLDFTAAQIGVCYGREGDGLPPPSRVVELFKQYNIKRMRIYDTDPGTLEALRGSGIEVTVGILNMKLEEIAQSRDNANAWVRDNVQKYGDVTFRHIIVGNEVRPGNPSTSQYAPLLLPAMRNIRDALVAANLPQVKVTTNLETEVLDPKKNFPPSRGEFREELKPFLNPIVAFLSDNDAPLFASIYPYFAYIGNRAQIPFDYAFLQPNPGVDDGPLHYDNLFYALLDTMNAALEKSAAAAISPAGDRLVKPAPVAKGGETGAPTQGGPADATASIETARIYNNNLVQAVKKGTPRRPDSPIETYIFGMFDENRKPGDESEKHFGLFDNNGNPKYPVNFN